MTAGPVRETFIFPLNTVLFPEGVLPLKVETLAPVDDPLLRAGIAPPDHVTKFRIG